MRLVRYAPLLGLVLSATACDDGGTIIHPPPPDKCAEGLNPTTDAQVVTSLLQVDGINWFSGINPSSLYDGRAAACIDNAGTQMELILSFGDDEPLGTFSVNATAPFASSLSDDGAASFTLDLEFMDAPSSWTSGTDVWVFGTWTVDSVGDPLSVQINGSAVSNGRTLDLELSASAAR